MTVTPYQDWTRYQVPGSNVVVNETVAATGTHVGPTTDASLWSAIMLYMDNNDAAAYLSGHVQWTSYNGTFGSNTAVFFTIGPTQSISMMIPVRDRKFNVVIDQASVAPTAGFDYSVYGMNHLMSHYDAKVDYRTVVNDTSAYGAGATKSFNFNRWYEGPASVAAFSTNNTAAWVEFQYYDVGDAAWEDFAITQILSWPNSLPHVIHCPPAPCRAMVNNQGAAQSIALHVTPAPMR